MKTARLFSMPILLLPCLVTVALLWPTKGQPYGVTTVPVPQTQHGNGTGSGGTVFPFTSTKTNSGGLFNSQFLPAVSPTKLAAATPLPANIPAPIENTRGDVKEIDRIVTKDGRVYPLRTYKALVAPNDPSANQWWVSPNSMQQVWDIPFGTRKTTIAIIDTGFALNHQEFSGRWATNSAEIAGNNIDDDNNGYVDDVLSWDFANNDASVQAGQNNPDGTGTTHGTMTAGVAAASGNNGVGIAGVNWYSSILPIQALDDNSIGNSFTVANAVYYAADRGADVISISLGTSQSDPYMREAIQYAIAKGSVVVASAGNDGCDCMVYPANYPEVIAVGASTPTGAVASFSSFGSNLDIIAPGQSMATSTWSKTNGTSAYASNVAGTSFSAPFVAGLLGLARNYQPNASWPEITGAMFEQANRTGLSAASPRTNQLGFGFARANTMLDRLRTPRTTLMRYGFSPLMTDSSRAYQCENDFPATPLYELTSTNQIRYTISPISQESGAQQGMATRGIGYVCMGLPTDTISILRVINLSAEIKNMQFKQ